MKLTTEKQVKEIIATIAKGEFAGVTFVRVAPKCERCGKSDKKWTGLTTCPHCGGKLSLERTSLVQFGVVGNADTPKGTGETEQQALENGRLKFYDKNAVKKDGTKGDFRQCRINLLKRLAVKGVEYAVEIK